jgi:hypothetical protein
MVMVSARLTRRWRLSYRHGLTNSAIAAERRLVVALRRRGLPGITNSAPRCARGLIARLTDLGMVVKTLCIGTMKSDPQAWRDIAGPCTKGARHHSRISRVPRPRLDSTLGLGTWLRGH